MHRREVLEDLIKKNDLTAGAEIGVYQGDTFFYLLDQCPKLRLFGIDHWKRSGKPIQDKDVGNSPYQNKPMEEIGKKVFARAEKYGYRAKIIPLDSVLAAKTVPDGNLDFVFIDADHATESVLVDIRNWLPKIRKGGFLTGHDVNWPSVRRAIDIAAPGWREFPGNMWIKQVK